MKILDDVGRNCVVKRSESGDSWKILALLDVGVNVKNGKRTFLKLRENLLLQVLVYSVNAHISSREELGEDAKDDVTTFISTLDLEDFMFIKKLNHGRGGVS